MELKANQANQNAEFSRRMAGYHLRVINNHIIMFNSGALVLLCDAAESVKEETVTELHDVGLVDASNFLQFNHLN